VNTRIGSLAARIGSLCTGYGGLDEGVRSVLGGELAWVADNDEGAAAILAHRFPSVKNLGDIGQADWSAVEPVDILAGGFPCQPVSLAGKQLGEADERWIWPAVARAVRDLRPGLVVLENVSALVVRGLAGVVADLAEIGYVGSWCCLRASDVGACHRRERVFILAWPAEDADRAVGGQWRLTAPGQAAGRRSRADAGGSGGVRAAADAGGEGLEVGAVEPDRDERPAIERSGRDAAADTDGGRLAELPELDGGTITRLDRAFRHDAIGPVLDWGIYTLAIRRWERALGRPAPRPTEPGRTGERLSPRFVEWMMGLPDGWVTDVPGLSRNAQLKALGNGVVPQQAALALRLLLPGWLEAAA